MPSAFMLISLFMGLPFLVVALLGNTNAIGLGRPALVSPAAALAWLFQAGRALAGFYSLGRNAGRRAGGGLSFNQFCQV